MGRAKLQSQEVGPQANKLNETLSPEVDRAWREGDEPEARVASLVPIVTPQLALASLPRSGDLAVIDEAPQSQEIQDLASVLGNNPLKIYNHLRQSYAFEAYWGSLRGAEGALRDRSGNAVDLASLLIALLRVSGIHSEYVHGKVDLSTAQVQNLTGITDTGTAGEMLASAGIPTVLLSDEGRIVGVRMEHVWVRALLDHIPSRGREQVDSASSPPARLFESWPPSQP